MSSSPEAPTTGYMFEKGIYFADLVSKSAQYCFTDKKNPVGLMLLSEVALGEMYELKKSKYMDKPPKRKDSGKGLRKKIPNESKHIKWKDDVVVPCGKSVSSNVKAYGLMYNGYIVYNTDQIIEEDKGSGCYVFWKWGRVSNEKIGGNKLEELSKSDAIQEFKRLFLEKIVNSWEAQEQKKLQKQPGKFYPLEIVFLLPDGQHLAIGSGDTTVRL
ncbi:unnamed protein product [Lactuca saligna]|uniref:Poly [ADP-ribose] polymerase n=1 Tax=Lactuca saligna TaxID=75948 RepID=A0AA36E2B6_LACSI|nr:unnamed protein product [Lactuca saligna]